MTDPQASTNDVAALVASVESMCWSIAQKVCGKLDSPTLLEDVAASARLSVVQSAQSFNPALGFAFTTYSYRLAWFYAVREFKNQAKHYHVLSLDYECGPSGRTMANHLLSATAENLVASPAKDGLASADDARALWSRIAQVLSPRSLHVLHLRFVEKLSLHTIATQLGISKQRVLRIEQMALDEIRTYCLDLLHLRTD